MYRFIPQWFVVFYQNFDKSYLTVADCTYTSINLTSHRVPLHNKLDGEFGKILPNDMKNAVNCLYTTYVNGDLSINTSGWVEIIKILIISRSSLMTFDQINIGRVTF